MRVKKSLGQHFLKSERALSKIVEVGHVGAGDTVLEIGPGMGALTKKLLATDCRVLAVEKDDNLYETLKIKFQKEIAGGKLTLIRDDILNFDIRSHNLKARNYKLIANIPYNITGAILKKFLETTRQPSTMVLLVQKEVAQRIVARPRHGGTSGKESILSISVKAYGTPRFVEIVKAGSFAPAPKVDSAIIAIENISKAFFQKIITGVDTECQRVEKDFFEMLRAGFKSKRKKLSSNLSTIFEKSAILEAFKKLGLDENIRAEDVNLKTWKKISLCLIETSGLQQ